MAPGFLHLPPMSNAPEQFKIRKDSPLDWLGVGRSAIVADSHVVRLRVGCSFATSVPRRAIQSAVTVSSVREAGHARGTRGVHGRKGNWLINGSNHGLVSLAIDPAAKARVFGLPVRLRRLTVSVDEPQAFINALRNGAAGTQGREVA